MGLRLSASAVAGAVLLLALVGCATNTPATSGDSSPEPGDDDMNSSTELEAAWLDDGRMIGLVTAGSSTCVPTATEATASGNTVTVELTDPAEKACTRDLVRRVSLVGLPEGVDPAQEVQIVVTGDYTGAESLDGVEGLAGAGGDPDFQPSAGWADDDIVLLTWGSSTCVPVVSGIDATGASELTVTFAEPDANQACTADMAPRGTVLTPPELEEDSGAELVLTGAEFDGVRVPIIG